MGVKASPQRLTSGAAPPLATGSSGWEPAGWGAPTPTLPFGTPTPNHGCGFLFFICRCSTSQQTPSLGGELGCCSLSGGLPNLGVRKAAPCLREEDASREGCPMASPWMWEQRCPMSVVSFYARVRNACKALCPCTHSTALELNNCSRGRWRRSPGRRRNHSPNSPFLPQTRCAAIRAASSHPAEEISNLSPDLLERNAAPSTRAAVNPPISAPTIERSKKWKEKGTKKKKKTRKPQ